jgi:hypothetical protein
MGDFSRSAVFEYAAVATYYMGMLPAPCEAFPQTLSLRCSSETTCRRGLPTNSNPTSHHNMTAEDDYNSIRCSLPTRIHTVGSKAPLFLAITPSKRRHAAIRSGFIGARFFQWRPHELQGGGVKTLP